MSFGAGVTIGIPVYNEESFIEAAIRSAAGQCEHLVVADNASTDRSAEICRRLAGEFPHMSFTRHAQNLGAAANFRFVMEGATTPYFMWLGAHDLLPSRYVENLKVALEADPTATLAYGAATHIGRDGKEGLRYEYPYHERLAVGAAHARLIALLRHLTDCSLVHGVFRTVTLKEALGDGLDYLGSDHVLLGRAVVAGRFVYVAGTTLLRRDVHVSDSRERQLERLIGAPGGAVRFTRMAQGLYRLAIQVSGGAGRWGALRYRLAAHYVLTYRWRRFGETPAQRIVELAFSAVQLPVRVLRWSRERLGRRES